MSGMKDVAGMNGRKMTVSKPARVSLPCSPGVRKVVKYGYSVDEKVRVCLISSLDLGLVHRLTGWMAICFLAEKLTEQRAFYNRGLEKPVFSCSLFFCRVVFPGR